jgi:hypothetical protein
MKRGEEAGAATGRWHIAPLSDRPSTFHPIAMRTDSFAPPRTKVGVSARSFPRSPRYPFEFQSKHLFSKVMRALVEHVIVIKFSMWGTGLFMGP